MSEPDSPAVTQKKSSFFARVVGAVKEDAWSTESLGDKSAQGRFYAAVRVIGITVKGVVLNKIPLNAAALTYYTLMSLGPILALVLVVAGTVIRSQPNGHELLKKAVLDGVHLVVPQAGATGEKPAGEPADDKTAGAVEPTKPISPAAAVATATIGAKSTITAAKAAVKQEAGVTAQDAAGTDKPAAPAGGAMDIDAMVDKMLRQSASGSAGAVGTTILIVLSVLMLTRVENAFNAIWGVTKGRPWKDRFINYVLFIMLGCLIGAASLTMLSAGSVAKSLGDHVPQWVHDMPGGTMLLNFFQGAGPTVISIALLAGLVGMLIRFLPYTRVHWKAAFGGGLFVALALVGNQKLGALYAGKVAGFQNLYGSMSIILVMMFGMYLSWMLLLIGCQLTFAVQYVHRLAAFRTWENISSRTRQTLCFGCLVIIARRLRAMEQAPDSEEMAAALHVPRSLTDECLKKLLKLKLIVAIDDGDNKPENDRYRPDFPLTALSVGEITDRLETYDTNIRIEPALGFDKGLVRYTEAFAHIGKLDHAKQSFDALLAETENATGEQLAQA